MPGISAKNPSETLTQRIHEAYDRLPERERRVADLLLQHPAELAVYTATELAQRAKVSNATVTRFFRRIGFSSFDAARQASRHLHARGSPLHSAGRRTPDSEFLSAILLEDIAVLEAALSTLNPLTLREIADKMVKARRVRIVGYRNSEVLAHYLAAGLSQLRSDVAMMPSPAQSLAEGLAQLSTDDMAIFVGLRRRPARFNDLLKIASGTGASLLLISDDSVRAAPAYARWTLSCAVQTSQTFDTYVGAIAIMRALVLSAANRLPHERRRHLERIEAFHDALGDLE